MRSYGFPCTDKADSIARATGLSWRVHGPQVHHHLQAYKHCPNEVCAPLSKLESCAHHSPSRIQTSVQLGETQGKAVYINKNAHTSFPAYREQHVEAGDKAAAAAAKMENQNDLVQEKPVVSPPRDDGATALANVPETATKQSSREPCDRDVALSKIEDEKKKALINAWEQSEKAKVDNKAQKMLSEVDSWEKSKQASLEHQLKKYEEELDKKRAEYTKKMKDKMTMIHKKAEEKRAQVEAKRGEETIKTEELAAKHRATGQIPKKGFGCFGA